MNPVVRILVRPWFFVSFLLDKQVIRIMPSSQVLLLPVFGATEQLMVLRTVDCPDGPILHRAEYNKVAEDACAALLAAGGGEPRKQEGGRKAEDGATDASGSSSSSAHSSGGGMPGDSEEAEEEGAVWGAAASAAVAAEDADRAFLSLLHLLLHGSHFWQLSRRDSELAKSLNADYLSQLFILGSSRRLDAGLVRMFHEEVESEAVAEGRGGGGGSPRLSTALPAVADPAALKSRGSFAESSDWGTSSEDGDGDSTTVMGSGVSTSGSVIGGREAVVCGAGIVGEAGDDGGSGEAGRTGGSTSGAGEAIGDGVEKDRHVPRWRLQELLMQVQDSAVQCCVVRCIPECRAVRGHWKQYLDGWLVWLPHMPTILR